MIQDAIERGCEGLQFLCLPLSISAV